MTLKVAVEITVPQLRSCLPVCALLAVNFKMKNVSFTKNETFKSGNKERFSYLTHFNRIVQVIWKKLILCIYICDVPCQNESNVGKYKI